MIKLLGAACISTPVLQVYEDAFLEMAKKYELYKKERVEAGHLETVGEGVLIWDEVKVSCLCLLKV